MLIMDDANTGANFLRTLLGSTSGLIALPTFKLAKESWTASLSLTRRPGELAGKLAQGLGE